MTKSSVMACVPGTKLAFTCSSGVDGGDGAGAGVGGLYAAQRSVTVPSPPRSWTSPPKPPGGGDAVAGRLTSIAAWLVNVAALHWMSITGRAACAAFVSAVSVSAAFVSASSASAAALAIRSNGSRSAVVTLSCSVNVSPMGQS